MEDKYKRQQLKSSEYYGSVIDISFYPEYELYPRKVASKGDPIYERRGFLGIKKIKVGEIDADRYDFYDSAVYHSSNYNKTLDELGLEESRVVRDNKLYRKAKVVITTKKGTESSWFNTNEDAIEFLEDVKTKCGQCGNKLL
jgi:hypothetical protein